MTRQRRPARNVRKSRGSRRNAFLPWRALTATAATVCAIGTVVVVCYGAPAGWQWFKGHPYFALRSVQIVGNDRLSRDQVERWAGIAPGSSIWDAGPRTLERRLRRQAWIEDAVVQRTFPGSVRIEVRERLPLAIVHLDGLQYVDDQGCVFGPLRDRDSRDFPVITGLESSEARGFAPAALSRAVRLLRRAASGSLLSVSEIHIDENRGLTVFPMRTTVAVVLGWGGWEEKLARVARVLAAWEGQEEWLLQVDVSFGDLAVLKLREHDHRTVVRSPKGGISV